MNKTRIHSLRTQAAIDRKWHEASDKRGLPGDGKVLAFWLNQPDSEWAKPKEKCAIEDLLSRLAEMMADVKRIVPNPNRSPREAVKRINAREALQAKQMKPINDILRRYTWIVELVGIGREGPSFGHPSRYRIGGSDSPDDHQVARVNLLDRVRKCAYGNCNKWFYATKATKIYCSEKCQQDYNRSTPKFKERSRKYHKKYYRDFLRQ